MDQKSQFACRLREARDVRGLNQGQLAARAGLPATAISHFEADARKPSFDSLRRLANALDVTTDWLLGRTDDPGSSGPTTQLHRDLQNMTDDDLATVQLLVKALADKKASKDTK
jgi:transcriptional regulator with XRE-family HTH domain